MAKRRARGGLVGDPETFVDSMFANIREAAAKELGRDDISVGDEAERLVVGLPLPSLSLRYLIQSNVMALGRVIQMYGLEGSAKTALLVELYRWHMIYGGGAVHNENENKDSPDMRSAVLQRNQKWLQRLQVVPCEVMEDWQDSFTYYGRFFREKFHADTLARTTPVCLGVDSLTGTAPKAEAEKTEEEGHSSLAIGRMARLISTYMRERVGKLRGYPMTIAATNHLKPGQDSMGRPVANVPGGKAVPFFATYMFEMRRDMNCDIDTEGEGGLRIRIKCTKNSLGPSRKSITANLVWWYAPDPADGVLRQWMAWDWHTSTIECLFDRAKVRKSDFKKITDVVDLRTVSGKKLWSRTLGIPESSPATYREAGQALEQREDLLAALYPLLGIAQRKQFIPGKDYRDQLEDASNEATSARTTLYRDLQTMPQLDPTLLERQAAPVQGDVNDDGAG